eukprot:7324371-Pyramimonas_sp.AAC.1
MRSKWLRRSWERERMLRCVSSLVGCARSPARLRGRRRISWEWLTNSIACARIERPPFRV